MKRRRWVAASLATMMLLTQAPIYAGAETVETDLTELHAFTLQDVTIEDAYLLNAMERSTGYLLSLDTDRLLAGFRETAGVDMRGAKRYNGWENSLIGGHTLGHYLTAVVQAYESANDDAAVKEALFGKITEIVDGLKECQDAVGTGYLFGATLPDRSNIEIQFDNVEANRTNISTQAWVPWYTMHKIFEGLISAASMTSSGSETVSKTALDTASKLGDWVYARVSNWDSGTRSTVLSIEYGGMNDALYDLYLLTGKPNHKTAAEAFDQTTLFDRVRTATPGSNVLNDLHANTTIPKFIGALKGYLVDRSKTEYREAAEAFWTLVTGHHTYVTGGNSEWEHFGKDDILDGERTNCNCETCNSYNMLKLTKLLYLLTGDVRYADWYENTFTNSILSSQNPETGMTTYFQPMASGYFKVFGDDDSDFWCCTGTGMENFTKLAESFYYQKGDIWIVDQYYSSTLHTDNLTLRLEASLPESDTVRITIHGNCPKLLLRLPAWLAKPAEIRVNGKACDYAVTGLQEGANGYAVLEGLSDGAVIEMTLPMDVRAVALPDGENTFAFRYGPVVLSALLGSSSMSVTTTGVSVSIPQTKLLEAAYLPSKSEKVTILDGSIADFIGSINDHMVRSDIDGKLAFRLEGTDANLTYVTHYAQYQQRYALYLRFSDDTSSLSDTAVLNDKATARQEAMQLDVVQPGYGQYENDALHRMTESGNGSVGTTDAGTSRYAKANGSFTYSMAVDPAGTDLIVTVHPEDNGKQLQILTGDTVLFAERLNRSGLEEYDLVIPIPAEALALAKDGRLDITFAATGADGAAIRGFVYTMKHLSADTSLAVSAISAGTLYFEEARSRFVLDLPDGVDAADVTFALPGKYAYLSVNGAVKDASSAIKLNAGETEHTGYLLTVTADDFVTKETYAFDVVHSTEPASTNIAYFVDCGDHTPESVSPGETLGSHNSRTEQVYGRDPATGYLWGVVDDPFDRYDGASISNGVYTANTWCYEFNATTDNLRADLTNRYTKNQFENGIPRFLDYRFELEDGTYELEIGFANPWNCSNEPTVYAYLDGDNEQVLLEDFDVLEEEGSATVTVSGGFLDLSIRTVDKAINLTFIRLRAKDAPTSTPELTLLLKAE